VLLDSRLLRQRRLETFLNFPRGSREVCGAVCPLVSLDNRADQRALCVPPEGTVGMRCRVGRPLKASPSMWAFIVAIIVFGLTNVISILVLFRYGMSDNQSLPPSTAAEKTFTVGTLIAFAIAASHWLPQLGW
jgi:hypothetical protein